MFLLIVSTVNHSVAATYVFLPSFVLFFLLQVQDRTIYEDSVFASMLYQSGQMEERDYATYRELFSSMSNFMRRPNLIVHLDLTPEESMKRINERNRGCESGISIEYLTALYNAYETFISEISRIIPVIKVDYSRFRTAKEMAHAIAVEYSELSTVRHVSWGKKKTEDAARPKDIAVAVSEQDIVPDSAPTVA